MAQRNLRGAADAVERHPRLAAALGVDDEEAASWRDAAEAMRDPLRRGARRAPPGRGLHRARGVGLRSDGRPTSIRCCCTSRTSTCTASRSSSRPTWCSRCTCAARRSPPSRRRATSPTTSALTVRDSSLSACTQAVDRGRGRPPRPRLRLLRRGRADGPRRPRAQHARRGPHRLAGGLLRSPRWRVSEGCATTAAGCGSCHGFRIRSQDCGSRSGAAGGR